MGVAHFESSEFVEFHGSPAELGRFDNQALDVFERDVFREVS